MTLEHDVSNEIHRAGCDDCRRLWAELDAIGAAAARLPLLSPSRDLWPDIDARLGSARARTRRWFRPQALRLAMAASLLVAVTATLTWQVADRDARPAVTAARVEPSDGGAVHLASLEEGAAGIDREIAALQVLVTERRAEIDPQTLAVLDANLRLIDRAIAESRAALAKDPASQFLAAQFARVQTSKLTLLRDAATLPAGI